MRRLVLVLLLCLWAAVAHAQQLTLSWTAGSILPDNSNAPQGFEIHRKLQTEATFGMIGSVPYPTLSFIDNLGLTSGQSASYEVRAYNLVGVSGFSNIGTGTPVAPPPPPPPPPVGAASALTCGYTLDTTPAPLVVTDNFNRANNADLGVNWTPNVRSWKIVSNAAQPVQVSNGDCTEHNTSAAWPNDQYSQATIIMLSGGQTGDGSGVGVVVRAAASANTLYRGVGRKAASNNTEIARFVNDTYQQLAQGTVTWDVGDVIRLGVHGPLLTLQKNGVTVLTASDGGITSGSPGITLSSTLLSAALDNWEGGAN